MRLHFGDGFPVSYRNEMKPTILANTTDAIAMVLEYMKDANISFSDILAHKLQEYLVNSRSENGWITKDFIIFDEKYTTNSNHIDYHILKRQESSFKTKVNHDTEHFTYPYYDDPHAKYFNHHHHHNCITISSSLPSFTISTSLSPSFNESIQSTSQQYLSNTNNPLNKIHDFTMETYNSCIPSSFNTTSTTTTTTTPATTTICTMHTSTTNTTISSSSTTTTDNNNNNIANTDSITDSIVEKFLYYVHENNSIPPSVLKKFESIIGIKSIDNWQNIIENKTLLHYLIHVLLQSGIDNWSSFLMYQSTPPPAPTTLPPISVEDEFLDYIVTSDSCDTSEEGDDDDDDGDDNERDDIESGLVNSSNCSLARTLVKSSSDIIDIDEFINYNEDDDDEDDDEEEEKRNNLNEDWNHLADFKTEDGFIHKSIRKLSINTKRRNKKSGNLPYLNRNYIELNSNFNLLEFSIDQLTNINYSEHKISLNSLQIIMKIITDQCEFRNAFLQYYPILSQKTYAGSYFIKCVDRIIQDDYIPTLQDLLIMKQSSKAVRESLITIGSITLRTINLGEHSEHLNKQFHYFESVNMILFFISLEDVYRFTYVQGNKFVNHQTFKLFEDIVNSPDLTKKDILVFLNKYDILKSIISQINNDTTQITINKEDDKTDIDKMKWIIKDSIRTILEINRKRHLIF
ncbi:unnamed protein product [Schistosoma margrebowiei]|uniref:Uncharacterized protein n=1 Tax=Schistosoma margrebowiei TaxID=48269 RepID=A0A183L900_9TREM|nr:unnamed protein product [Schistosoma margrebowiei]